MITTFKLHIFYPRTSHRIYLTLYAKVQIIVHLISQIATIMLMFFLLQPHFWVQIAMNFTCMISRSYYIPTTNNRPIKRHVSVTCHSNSLRCRTATYWTAIFGQVTQSIHLRKSQDYLFGMIIHLYWIHLRPMWEIFKSRILLLGETEGQA